MHSQAAVIETIRTATHEFYISPAFQDKTVFSVDYRPLNPKTGEPWQADRRVEIGADATPGHWDRPVAFTTIEKARAAVQAQMSKLRKGR